MKIAVVQMDVELLNKERNVQVIVDRAEEAARNGAEVVIFPECALTGYCFDRLAEAMPEAEPVPGPFTERLAHVTQTQGCTAVVGMLERDGNTLYNTAAVVGPRGLLGAYRKLHLPYLGVDRFVTPGDRPFPLFPIPGGQVGINICYDCSFPEAGRVPKLKGAQVLAIPTNWPIESDSWQEIPKVRAIENHLVVAAADRVGQERGFHFAGHSQIIDCTGKVLARAGESEETILYGDIDMASADQNLVARVPGAYEIDRIADRRPDMYQAITDPVIGRRRG